MTVVASSIAAVAIALALVFASRFWFDRIARRNHEQRIGIEMLNGKRWRDALDLLVRGMALEGTTPLAEPSTSSGAPVSERHVQRPGLGRTLLVYKHGTTYLIGAAGLLDAERRRQEAELDGVIIATLGSIDPDALAQAERMKITCLDGPAVWRLVRNALDDGSRDAIAAEAGTLVERPRRLATVAAAALGLGIVVFGADLHDVRLGGDAAGIPLGATSASPPSTSPAPETTREAATAPAGTSRPTEIGAPSSPAVDAEATRRAALAKALADLPEIERASWSTSNTLVLSLRPGVPVDAAVVAACALADAFPMVRDIRLQIEAGGGADVRWRRCG